MRDFTLPVYRLLLQTLQKEGYAFLSVQAYFEAKELPERFVILRHDIDKHPRRALAVAQIEQELGVPASYYFRAKDIQRAATIIQTLAQQGFEIGYHYEDLVLCHGNLEKAKAHFDQALAQLRQYYPVQTISRHGNPLHQLDAQTLWQTYDYRASGIIGEACLDANFDDLLYLTDTGRRWDGSAVSVYDKIPAQSEKWQKRGYVYHSTYEILRAVRMGTFAPKTMLTTHPQRWNKHWIVWQYERVRQLVVNQIKRLIVANK